MGVDCSIMSLSRRVLQIVENLEFLALAHWMLFVPWILMTTKIAPPQVPQYPSWVSQCTKYFSLLIASDHQGEGKSMIWGDKDTNPLWSCSQNPIIPAGLWEKKKKSGKPKWRARLQNTKSTKSDTELEVNKGYMMTKWNAVPWTEPWNRNRTLLGKQVKSKLNLQFD